jgi:hypothetical protein
MQQLNHRTIVAIIVVGLVAAPSLVSGGVTAPPVTSPTPTVAPSMTSLNDTAEPALRTRHAQRGTANDTVALDNVTVEAICTDYKANRATFEIINNDDDTAIVSYLAADAAGGSGTVTIPPGESVRVDDINTTSIATGLEQGAITLFVENAPGEEEQGINYGSDPSPCGDTVPTYLDVVFTNQTTFDRENFAVTIDEVALPEGGFVVFTNKSGAVVGTSYYIGQGIAEQVDVDLHRAFEDAEAGDQTTLTATLYRDTNDNGTFDPAIDQPYESECGTTSATATVTYGGDEP